MLIQLLIVSLINFWWKIISYVKRVTFKHGSFKRYSWCWNFRRTIAVILTSCNWIPSRKYCIFLLSFYNKFLFRWLNFMWENGQQREQKVGKRLNILWNWKKFNSVHWKYKKKFGTTKDKKRTNSYFLQLLSVCWFVL